MGDNWSRAPLPWRHASAQTVAKRVEYPGAGVDRQRRVYSLVQYVVNRTERAADGKTAAKAGS